MRLGSAILTGIGELKEGGRPPKLHRHTLEYVQRMPIEPTARPRFYFRRRVCDNERVQVVRQLDGRKLGRFALREDEKTPTSSAR